MIYIGIDPGLTGAVALLHDGRVVIAPTPVVQEGKKKEYLPSEMGQVLYEALQIYGHGDPKALYAVLERQQAFPGQGSVSTGSIMRCFGLWEGMLAALRVPYECPRPKVWQQLVGRKPGKDKAQSIIRVKQLFPDVAEKWTKSGDHGKADALLLAEYGRRVRS